MDEIIYHWGKEMAGWTATIILENPDATTETVRVAVEDDLMEKLKRKKVSVRALLPPGEARRIVSIYIKTPPHEGSSSVRVEAV